MRIGTSLAISDIVDLTHIKEYMRAVANLLKYFATVDKPTAHELCSQKRRHHSNLFRGILDSAILAGATNFLTFLLSSYLSFYLQWALGGSPSGWSSLRSKFLINAKPPKQSLPLRHPPVLPMLSSASNADNADADDADAYDVDADNVDADDADGADNADDVDNAAKMVELMGTSRRHSYEGYGTSNHLRKRPLDIGRTDVMLYLVRSWFLQ